MKIALYIEDGRSQIVLTPEGNHEKGVLGKLQEMHEKGSGNLAVYRGCFYQCVGGWTRQGSDNDSTILVLDYE